MSQSAEPLTAAEWVMVALFFLLLIVALLAPFAPFAVLLFVARTKPALVEAFWRHPWRNGLLVAVGLAAARVVFLLCLSLLGRVLSAAIHPAAYAWYPEMIAREYLSGMGWDVSPRPDESLLRFYGLVFLLNLAFWLGVLAPAAVGRSFRRPA